MIFTLTGIAIAATQVVLYALGRPTLSRRRRCRWIVGAWCAATAAHMAYEATLDRIAADAARGFAR